jgi:hypothetical protein
MIKIITSSITLFTLAGKVGECRKKYGVTKSDEDKKALISAEKELEAYEDIVKISDRMLLHITRRDLDLG